MTKKKQNIFQTQLRFYASIVGSVLLLVYCADLVSPKRRLVCVDDEHSLRIDAYLEEEREMLEKMDTAPRPTVPRTIVAGAPDMEEFQSLQIEPYEDGACVIADKSPENQKEKLSEYVREQVTHCRELLFWYVGCSRSNSGEMVPFMEPALAYSLKANPAWNNAHLSQIGNLSVFASEDEVLSNPHRMVRFRMPIFHTDLARLLYLHHHARDGKTITHSSISGSQAITGEMYTAYKLACRVVDGAKRKSRKGEKITEYETALALHDFLCNNVAYEKNMHAAANDSLVVGTLLQQKATSHGYARTYMLLLTMAGIENRYVEGCFFSSQTTRSDLSIPRAWNLVRLDGHWVYIDVAADDFVPDEDYVSHCYFGLSAPMLKYSHRIELVHGNSEKIDETGDCYYFRRMRRSYRNEEALLNAVIDNAWPNRIRCAEYHCADSRITVSSIHEALSLPSIQEKLDRLNIRNIKLDCSHPDSRGVVRIAVLLNDELDK